MIVLKNIESDKKYKLYEVYERVLHLIRNLSYKKWVDGLGARDKRVLNLIRNRMFKGWVDGLGAGDVGRVGKVLNCIKKFLNLRTNRG